MSGFLFTLIITLIVIVVILEQVCQCSATEDYSHWKRLADEDIITISKVEKNKGIAKNVILFVGDGLGPNTITAARIYGKGEHGYLAFEKFPYTGTLKTYSANKMVPDSCSTATALFCGVKVNQKTSGVDATVTHGDCQASLDNTTHLESIFTWAQKAGKSTGFVTTTRVTHATPSALYAHTPDRQWECEATIPSESSSCKDIARQLVENEPGKNINVIMGGGRQCFQHNVTGSQADPIDTWACFSVDGRDLIRDWENDKIARGLSYSVVQNNSELENLNTNSDYVLGLFANGHLKMDHERDVSSSGMPSLVNMTEKALSVLMKNPNGYILMVEGGMIDFAHHRGHARQALQETLAFSDAVQSAIQMTKDEEQDTLIIVTSDHSHSLVFAGYADRGTSILDVAQPSKMDGVNYTTLLYGTGGPDNYQYEVVDNKVVRPAPANTQDYNYAQQAAVLTDEVTHSGTDVNVYGTGPHSFLLSSTHEQTYVAYVVAYAARIGPFEDSNSSQVLSLNIYSIVLPLLLYAFFNV